LHHLVGIFRSIIDTEYKDMDEYLPDGRVNKKKMLIIGTGGAIFLGVLAIVYHIFFAALAFHATNDRFVITSHMSVSDLGYELKSQGYIRKMSVFDYLLDKKVSGDIPVGTYTISKSMNVWQMVSVFEGAPSEYLVYFPPGLRKEEIAKIIADTFGWTKWQEQEFLNETNMSPDYFEGVYFPDTYLIPKNETPINVAKRLRAHFEEKFAPYAKIAAKQNMKWTTVLKVASLVQREAGSKADMPVIAGIIWNRLDQNMKLQIDATVAYARGDTGVGWWAPIKHDDESIDSPYNTYMYKGLPPHPICNPGLDAISAAVNSASTKCVYYIHDSSRNIHCAVTNTQQNANISKYLR